MTTSPGGARAAAALAVVASAPLATLASALLLDPPARLTVTWAGDRADSTAATVALAAPTTALGAAAVVAAAAVLASPRSSFLAGRVAVCALSGLSRAGAGMWSLFAVTAAGDETPAAPSPPGVEALLPLAAVLLGARLAALAYGNPSHDPVPPPPAAGLPRADIAADEPLSTRHDVRLLPRRRPRACPGGGGDVAQRHGGRLDRLHGGAS